MMEEKKFRRHFTREFKVEVAELARVYTLTPVAV